MFGIITPRPPRSPSKQDPDYLAPFLAREAVSWLGWGGWGGVGWGASDVRDGQRVKITSRLFGAVPRTRSCFLVGLGRVGSGGGGGWGGWGDSDVRDSTTRIGTKFESWDSGFAGCATQLGF